MYLRALRSLDGLFHSFTRELRSLLLLSQNMNIEPVKETINGINPTENPTSVRIVDDPEAFEISDLCRRWQPMGIRVVVKMPYISNEQDPLFAIAVNPFIPPIQSEVYKYYSPVFPLPNKPTGNVTGSADTIPVTVTVYDGPPLLSLLSVCHRFFSGGLRYRIRVISGAFSQGMIVAGLHRGTYGDILWKGGDGSSTLVNNYRHIYNLNASYRTFMLNAYTLSDLSLYRHIEVECPYQLPYPVFNQDKFLGGLSSSTAVQPYSQPMDYIIVAARGTMTPTSGTTELIMELEYAGADDFTLLHELNLNFLSWNKDFTPDDLLTFPVPFTRKKKNQKTRVMPPAVSTVPSEVAEALAKARAALGENVENNI